MAMRHAIYILFSCLSFLVCATLLQAQTPYDSFAPEAYRPILELEKHQKSSPDTTILCAIFADFQNQKLLFVNVSNGEIITTASTTDDIHKWLTVDPLTDNYPGVSPYAYCGWNPVRFVDRDGREITITGDDGVTVTYVHGEKYDGNDGFIKKIWSQLDEIYSTTAGGIVLNELITDDGCAFNVSNQQAKGPNGLDVVGYVIGKRQLRMGGENQFVEALAHEFFHAYQDLHGYGGASCANDVEAYIFQGLVYAELYGGEPFGAYATYELQPIDNQSLYFNTYVDIMSDGILNTDRINNMAKGFNRYSRAGANGIAIRYTTFSKNQQYRILNFWGK